MLILCLLTVFLGDLEKQSTFRVQVDYSRVLPKVKVDPQGNIWWILYWEEKIYKISPTGETLLLLNPGSDIPGGFANINSISFIGNGEQVILNQAQTSNLIMIGGDDAKFDRFLLRPGFLGNKMHRWSNQNIIFLYCTMPNKIGKHNVCVYSLKGELIESWYKASIPLDIKAQGCGIFHTVQAGKRLFYSGDCQPTVVEYAPYQTEGEVWDLRLPKHYTAPPDRAFNLSERFDRRKISDYFDNFSQIHGLEVLDDQYLAVCWRINQGHPFSLDIYDIETRELLLRDYVLPGPMMDALGDVIYVMQDDLFFDIDGQELDVESEHQVFVHTYRWKPQRIQP